MMNYSVSWILLMLFISSPALAQKKKKQAETFASADVFIGQNVYMQSFYGQLNTVSDIRPGEPVLAVGLGLAGDLHATSGKWKYTHSGGLFYQHVLPQKIVLDTIVAKITGFTIGCTVWGIDLLPAVKKGDIIVCAGLNTGRLRITGNDLAKAKNPFLSPKVSLMPRVRLGLLTLGLCAEYGYDFSFSKWRKMRFSDAPAIQLNKFRQSGINCYFSLGFVF